MSCAAAGGAEGTDGRSVAYSAPIASQPNQAVFMTGATAAAEDLGWTFDELDANLSPDTQVSDIQTMVQQQRDAIGLWALDQGAVAGALAQATSAGIPVVGVNTDAEGVTTTVWWELNRCDSDDAPYRRAAALVAEQRPGARVIVMGGPPVAALEFNADCFTEAAQAAGLEVVARADNTSDTAAGGSQLAADLLLRHPDVDMVWAYNDSTALGVSAAVAQLGLSVSDGRSEGVIIHGGNADRDALEAIRQGRLTGTWDPDPKATGAAVVRAMRDAMDGEPSDMIIITSTFWDASTIDQWVEPADRDYTDLDALPVTDE